MKTPIECLEFELGILKNFCSDTATRIANKENLPHLQVAYDKAVSKIEDYEKAIRILIFAMEDFEANKRHGELCDLNDPKERKFWIDFVNKCTR